MTAEAKKKLEILHSSMDDVYWGQVRDTFNNAYNTAFSLLDLLKDGIENCLTAELIGKELRYTGYGALLQARTSEDETCIEQEFKDKIAGQRQEYHAQQLAILEVMENLREVCCVVSPLSSKIVEAGK